MAGRGKDCEIERHGEFFKVCVFSTHECKEIWQECSHVASRGRMSKKAASGPKTDGKSGEVGQGEEELKRKMQKEHFVQLSP